MVHQLSRVGPGTGPIMSRQVLSQLNGAGRRHGSCRSSEADSAAGSKGDVSDSALSQLVGGLPAVESSQHALCCRPSRYDTDGRLPNCLSISGLHVS